VAQARINIPVSAAAYAAAIEGLSNLNQHVIRSGGFDYPSIYRAGIRYRRESKDIWRPINEVYKSGFGDCEDLAAARVAWLRERGEKGARVGVYQSGPKRYHAIVIRGDGSREDPSKALGMNSKPKRIRLRRRNCRPIPGRPGAWVAVGEDTAPAVKSITFDLYRSGKGYSGIVRMPLADGKSAIFAKTTPTSEAKGVQAAKQATAAKSIRLAAKIATNPAVQALLPPQAALAVKALKSPLGKLATKGTVSAFKKLF